MSIKAVIPWQAKIVAKLILSRIPAGYSFWRKLTLFKQGSMEKPAYAYAVFKYHYERAEFSRRNGGFVAMEIGPGDSLFSGMIARAFGASSSYLVDVGDFARHDMGAYRAMRRFLLEKGLPSPEISACNSLEDLLITCNGCYLTSGLTSLRTIPSQSVDFVWSQAVLEHIRQAEFPDFMREMRRVMRDDGVCSHRVDLRDHLSGSLNNLRFSEQLWESNFMASSGFYTNRIRYTDMLNAFERAGFGVHVVNVERWDRLPTQKTKLSTCFKQLPEEELAVCGFDVVLQPV